MEIYLSIHRRGSDVLVAACDKDVLGRTFSGKGVSITANKEFYCGKLSDAKELERVLSDATMANLLGNGVVSFAVRKGFIKEENVLDIGGVKHAQLYVI